MCVTQFERPRYSENKRSFSGISVRGYIVCSTYPQYIANLSQASVTTRALYPNPSAPYPRRELALQPQAVSAGRESMWAGTMATRVHSFDLNDPDPVQAVRPTLFSLNELLISFAELRESRARSRAVPSQRRLCIRHPHPAPASSVPDARFIPGKRRRATPGPRTRAGTSALSSANLGACIRICKKPCCASRWCSFAQPGYVPPNNQRNCEKQEGFA